MATKQPPNFPFLDDLWATAIDRGHKPISVYFKAKDAHEANTITLTPDDLEWLGEKLGYKPAWAGYKAEELGLIGNAPTSATPFFDGQVTVTDLKELTTGKGETMLVGSAKPLHGREFPWVIFPNAMPDIPDSELQGLVIGNVVYLLGIWGNYDGRDTG